MPTLTIDLEKQFTITNLKFYTRYEEFLEAIRNEELEIYKDLKSWFSFFYAYICSWAHLHTKGRKFVNNKQNKLLQYRRVRIYEEDFKEAVDSIFNKEFK